MAREGAVGGCACPSCALTFSAAAAAAVSEVVKGRARVPLGAVRARPALCRLPKWLKKWLKGVAVGGRACPSCALSVGGDWRARGGVGGDWRARGGLRVPVLRKCVLRAGACGGSAVGAGAVRKLPPPEGSGVRSRPARPPVRYSFRTLIL